MYKINKGFIFTITLFLCSSLNCHIFASGMIKASEIDYSAFKQSNKRIKKIDKKYYTIVKDLGDNREKIAAYLQNESREIEKFVELVNNKVKFETIIKEFDNDIEKIEMYSQYLGIRTYLRENEKRLIDQKKIIEETLPFVIFLSCLVIIQIIIRFTTETKLSGFIFSWSLIIDIIFISIISKSIYFVIKMSPIIQLYNDVWR